jgi:hypothetical protein
MTEATIVRYETHPDSADANEALVKAVYAELAATDPGHLRYATFRLDDGVTFLHVAVTDGENPLTTTAAFAAFQSGIRERCAVPPAPVKATLVGSYGLS